MKIIVSGGLDEYDIHLLLEKNSPIDVFALGTKVITSSDRPYLDMAYKLVEYGGQPKLKLSPRKVTFPYKRQVFRYYTNNGEMKYDKVAKYGEEYEGESLVIQVLEEGKNIFEFPTLHDIKEKFEKDLNALPMKIRGLEPSVYKVVVK